MVAKAATANTVAEVPTPSVYTGSIACSYTHNITVYRRVGIVTVSGYVSLSSSVPVTVGTIDAGYRPKYPVYGICLTNCNSTNWRLSGMFCIDSSGVLTITVDNTGNLFFSTCYNIH